MSTIILESSEEVTRIGFVCQENLEKITGLIVLENCKIFLWQ
jgi:hypothetical protein